jgi:PAS domain S-box-containing protein
MSRPLPDPEQEREIAQLRSIQQELRASEARLRSIVESALDAIVTIDHDNRITEFNPAAEAIFGWRREEVLGQDLGEKIIPPAMRAAHRRGLARHLLSQTAPRLGVRLELSALRRDGSEFPVELTVARIAGGAQPSFTAFVRDLTATREAQDEAQRLAAQLRASELQYRSLFVNNPQPMAVYDPETLRFLAVNIAGVAQYGYSEADFLTMTIEDLRPPEDRESWQREVFGQPLLGPRRYRGRHRRKDGTLVHVDVSAADIVFEGRRARLVLAIDVSEQRSAARQLRESEARFRALTELSADWYWEQDADLRFVDIHGGERWPLGIMPVGNILGKRRWELEGTEVEGGWDAHKATLARHEPFRDFEIRRRSAAGGVRVLSLSGTPMFDSAGRFRGYRGVGRDITDARRAQDALAENQRMLSVLLANFPGIAYRCRNEPDWPADFVSQGALKLTGYAPSAFTSGEVRYTELIHPDDREGLWEQVQAAMDQAGQFQFTYRVIARDGSHKWAWEQGGAVVQAGQVVAMEGFVIDVTEARQAQEEVARLNTELEERVRQRTAQLEAANAELEAFSYSIAHDLRSPLTSIDGFSHVLETSHAGALDAQGLHCLRRIRAGVFQMSELTDALLSLAHLSRVKLRSEPVDLAQAARQALAQLQENEPDRALDAAVPPRLPQRGDPRLLGQVMANLVGNAWKFSARKPRTRIEVGTLAGPSGETIYFVADQGAGFDMVHASRLFGAFQRLHGPSEFEGTGIGLALVQKIIQRHGGRIWAEARPGEGATFYFTLGEAFAA